MRAEIITIGDELLIGQVVDTNSAWIAERLNEYGIELYQITSVHDDRQQIIAALDEAFSRADIVLTTGGLGPTKDDITKHVLCEYFSTDLIEDAHVREHIEQLYSGRPDVLNRLTATQYLVPRSAEILENRVGSAPLMIFHRGHQLLACMPGVPYEMKIAMDEQILPYIGRTDVNIIHRTLQLSGIAESSLALILEDYENSMPESLHLAYLPKDGVIRLRLSSYGELKESEVNEWTERLKTLVGDYLVADTDEPFECLLGRALKSRQCTIATAESCTGGKLASLLNKHAGSSDFYMGSVVAYDNRVKHEVLGVSNESLEKYGAVSETVVRQMAEGARRLLGTDYAIATSGIAGPGGGTKQKPVGTVWIAWAGKQGTDAECFSLGKLREQVTDRACQKALIGMLRRLSVLLLAMWVCVGCGTRPKTEGHVITNKYATGFSITEEDSCLLLEVKEPYTQYRISKPLERLGTSSVTQVGFLSELQASDKIVAVCNPELIYTPLPRKPIDMGDSMKPSAERVLQAGLDALLVVSYGQSNPEAERLEKLGVKTIYINEWREVSPLARAEWIRFVGALVGKLEQADSIFETIEQRYLAAAAKHSKQTGKGTSVLIGNNFRGTWYMPSGKTYMGYLLRDAGAQYPLLENDSRESIPLTIEQVVHQFSDAEVWIGAQADNLQELAELDEKHTWFRAYKDGRVYNWRGQYREGRNNFWERGVVHPEEILEDIVHILDLNYQDTLHYARRLIM